ncbi:MULTISPECIES: VRR-NUC domain-containing protein [Caballeronia]|uniref:VRR-NUC domain-containing protein n=1 Tax=Caballeronia TaxID=1827195 RepID=UPI001FD36826|nr:MULTISPECIES: VRR-NUC domain-containing protein [Caballeronia]MDR5799050.1 VRR-NUC domain-containing protein [Caballeronia sp. LZ001]
MGIRFTEAEFAALQGRRGKPTVPTETASKPSVAQVKAAVRSELPTIRETDVLLACLELLERHPAIAWCMRMNTGAAVFGEGENQRFVKFSEAGVSDIIGQLKDGRFLAVEVKRPGNTPTDDQWAFLRNVASGGGVAGWVDDPTQLRNFIPNRLSLKPLLCPVYSPK